jgi:hypothetical protein
MQFGWQGAGEVEVVSGRVTASGEVSSFWLSADPFDIV